MSPDILEPQEIRAELVQQERSQLEESTEKGGTSSIERSPFLKGRIPLKVKSLPEGSSSSLRRRLASLFKARSQPDPSSELGGRHPVKKQQLDILQVNKLQRKLFPRSKKQADKERNPQLYPYMPALFAFGDSDFDAGNNLYLNLTAYKATKYPPYGESYFGIRGRFCDGRLIPDFLGKQTCSIPFQSSSSHNSLVAPDVCVMSILLEKRHLLSGPATNASHAMKNFSLQRETPAFNLKEGFQKGAFFSPDSGPCLKMRLLRNASPPSFQCRCRLPLSGVV
jgi:hypothetical protein